MGILADWQIRELCQKAELCVPYYDEPNQKGRLSNGIGSYGYDLTLSDEYHVFSNVNCVIIDPKNFDEAAFTTKKGPFCIIPPNSYVLGRTVEYVTIPRDCLALVSNKSTLVRCGICCPFSILEPEWKGHVTLEIANQTPLPAKIYAGEGIAQMLLIRADDPSRVCEISYADRKGRYQGQTGITKPFVR